MKARISQLHKTEYEWNKIKSWVPVSGEFIVYDPDNRYTYARLKVGDGKSSLEELPFIIDCAIIKQQENIDAGRITDYN